MKTLRKYGSEPYEIILVHGGPGAPGSLDAVASKLSASSGILVPEILSKTIDDQIEELKSIVINNTSESILLSGHSWGAWLSLMFASRYPRLVKKLIMIGAPPFEEKYARTIEKIRLSRLTKEERKRLANAEKQHPDLSSEKETLSYDFISMITKADVFEALPDECIGTSFYPEVFTNVWAEASKIRSSGKLLEYVRSINCQVVAIHGDHDPHPAEGVRVPLTKIIPDFRFYLIKKCGHYPWIEKYGKDRFYEIMFREIKMTGD